VARKLADPPDVAADVLWRSLLPLRPERAIPTRLRGIAHAPFLVRAVPAMALALADDAGRRAAGGVDELQSARAAGEVLSLVLYTTQGRAFPTAAALGRLDGAELAELARDAFAALAEVCPTYARSNTDRWSEVLRDGAGHPSNLLEAVALGSCVDVGPAGGGIPRPDRYWGVPLRELCDGHWLAFRAARDVLADAKPATTPSAPPAGSPAPRPVPFPRTT
jgi:hypothetical protein